VTQSKFFSPAFNAAIFDGPIRIYFAQHQESQALKLYFVLQDRFQTQRKDQTGLFKDRTRNIFVMIYPSDETYEICLTSPDVSAPEFASADLAGLAMKPLRSNGKGSFKDRLGSDFVLGICGPLDDQDIDDLAFEVESIVQSTEQAVKIASAN